MPVSGSTTSPRKNSDTFRLYFPLIFKSCQIQVDGNTSEWQGMPPLGYSLSGDSSASTAGGDLRHLYAQVCPDATYFLWEMSGPITDASLGYQLLFDMDMDGITLTSPPSQDIVIMAQPGSCPSIGVAGWTCAFKDRYLEMGVRRSLLPPFQHVRVEAWVINISSGSGIDRLWGHNDVYLRGTQQLTAGEATALQTRAAQAHMNGWQHLLQTASTDPYSRYAIYSSRILAVKHPEVYLLADIALLDDMHTHPTRPYTLTVAAAYAYPIVHEQAFFPPLYPFLPFLDRLTMGPASTLKNLRNSMLSIDRAILTYCLQRSLHSQNELYILYTDNDHSYLSMPEGLLDVTTGGWVLAPTGNPVLIFNENAAWYPLLERDDTSSTPSLATIVAQYGGAVQVPTLTPQESSLIASLRQTTGLSNAAQFAVAIMAASKGGGLPSVRARVMNALAGQALVWGQGDEIRMRDARLSPVAAYFVGLLQGYGAPRRWLELSAAMSDEINVRTIPEEDDLTNDYSDGWRDPWGWEGGGAPNAQTNLNEMYYSRIGSDSRMFDLGEVAKMAGEEPYFFNDARSRLGTPFPIGGPPHLLLPSSGILFFSADITAGRIFDNQLVWPGASIAARSMEFFNHNGQFAAIIINQYYGTMSPTTAGQIATHFHNTYTDERYFVRWNGYAYTAITYAEFMQAISAEQAIWQTLPPLP